MPYGIQAFVKPALRLAVEQVPEDTETVGLHFVARGLCPQDRLAGLCQGYEHKATGHVLVTELESGLRKV